MDKRILKKIAKEWAAGILYHGTGMDSFDPDLGLTREEEAYIVDEVQRLGESLTKSLNQDYISASLRDIIGRYYEIY